MTNQLNEIGGNTQRSLRIPQVHFDDCDASIYGETTPAMTIFVVDSNRHARNSIRDVLATNGYDVKIFAGWSNFLDSYRPNQACCLLVDEALPDMAAPDLIEHLHSLDHDLPALVLTENATVRGAVRAMRAGATDYIEKPVTESDLLFSVKRARRQRADIVYRKAAGRTVANLTNRQHQILDRVLDGQPSKNIAADLGISQRTVENHRAAIMKKSGSKSLPALVRSALCAQCRYDGLDQRTLNS